MQKSLNDIKSIIDTYQSQMLVIAHQYHRQVWLEEFNHDPFAQIETDMGRLNGLLAGLKTAVDELGAKTLTEACEVLRQSGEEETVATLDYVLHSEYEGFVRMSRLLERPESLAAAC